MKKRRKQASNFGAEGVIVCTVCGKRTRETGAGEEALGMCKRCIEDQEWANGINDGTYTLDDVPASRREGVKQFL